MTCRKRRAGGAAGRAGAARRFSRPRAAVSDPPLSPAIRRSLPSALIGHPAPQTVLAAGRRPRSRRRAGPGHRSGEFQGRGHGGERLGVVVRAVPRRGAAAAAARARQPAPPRRHQLQGRAGQCAALPRPLRRSVRRGRRRRQRPRRDRMGRLWRAGDLRGRPRRRASPTSWSARSRRRISTPCSSRRSKRRWRAGS